MTEFVRENFFRIERCVPVDRHGQRFAFKFAESHRMPAPASDLDPIERGDRERVVRPGFFDHLFGYFKTVHRALRDGADRRPPNSDLQATQVQIPRAGAALESRAASRDL